MTRPEPPPQHHVGGLWCHEVLEALPDVIDGSVAGPRRAAIDAHLAGCDWCARFGGEYAHTVATLQRHPDPSDVPDELSRRLADRLGRALDAEG